MDGNESQVGQRVGDVMDGTAWVGCSVENVMDGSGKWVG